MGLEGIVSKRKDSAYRSGRSPDWLKMKNADAPTGSGAFADGSNDQLVQAMAASPGMQPMIPIASSAGKTRHSRRC
jgi:hypothetical protein